MINQMHKMRSHNRSDWHAAKYSDDIDWNRVSYYHLSRILCDNWVELTHKDWKRLVAYHQDLIDEMPRDII